MPRYLSIRIIPKLGPKVCKHYLHLAVWNPGRLFTPNPKPIESPGGFGSFGSATGAAAALGCGGPGRSKGFAGHGGCSGFPFAVHEELERSTEFYRAYRGRWPILSAIQRGIVGYVA